MALDNGPDLGAIGNAARMAKPAAQTSELTTVSVKRGDNGGVIICESYKSKPPEGRRYGASFQDGGYDYKENPYSPTDGAKAAAYLKGLLAKMGMSIDDRAEEAAEAAPRPVAAAVRTPTFGAARGPNAAGVTGPAGTTAVRIPPRVPPSGGY